MSAKSKELSGEIVARLDIRQEYEQLGISFTAAKPTAKGWIACHAWGRDDKKPSAAVCVTTGVYKDHCGVILNIFDFAVHCGKFPTWQSARKHYAILTKLDKRLPKSDTKEDYLLDKFDFHKQWNSFLVKGLIAQYPGIDDLSLRRSGSQIGNYPKSAPHPDLCVCTPIYGLHLTDNPPVGYIVSMASGKNLTIYRGKDAPADEVKRAVVGETGLVNRRGVEMIADGRAKLVLKVEGYTDALAWQAKIPDEWIDRIAVITNACGANETTLPAAVAPVFSGIPVIVIHDADTPGQNGAAVWVTELSKFTRAVNLRLPYVVEPKHGKDSRDWLNEGNGIGQLFEMVEQQCPGWLAGCGLAGVGGCEGGKTEVSEEVPFEAGVQHGSKTNGHAIKIETPHIAAIAAESPKPGEVNPNAESLVYSQILKRINMIALGIPEDTDDVVGFRTDTGRTFTLKRISNLKLVDLLLHLGDGILREILAPGQDPKENPFKIPMQVVQMAIAIEGGKTRLTGKSYFGVGIWHMSDRILMVNAGEATIVNGEVSKTTVPIIENRIFDFGSNRKWFDHDWFAGEYERTADLGYCKSVFAEAVEIFGRWDNWAHSHTPEIAAALICVTWCQVGWEYRPQVCLIGGTNSGKSSLFRVVRWMFCRGEMQVGGMDPTAASIRQFLRNTAKAIIVDEFEPHSKHREECLKMFRGSSSGETVNRGTSGSQKGVSFTLRHLPWHGAISADFREAADRNRYLILELNPVAANRGSTLVMPSDDECERIGLNLMVLAVRHLSRAKEIAAHIKKIHFAGVDRRIVESYSVPVSMISAIHGNTNDEAVELMNQVFKGRDFNQQSESDEQGLLKAIYESPVRMEGGKEYTMSMLIKGLDSGSAYGYHEAMQRSGVRKFPKKKTEEFPEGEPCIFFCESVICSNLFRDKSRQSTGIIQILSRIKGAVKDRQRLGSHIPYGVTIPERVIKSLLANCECEDDESVVQTGESSTCVIEGSFADGFD